MKPQINLYNPALQRKKPSFSGRSLMLSIALMTAGGFLFYAYTYLSVSHLRLQNSATTRQIDEARAKLAALSRQFPPRKKSRELEEEIVNLQKDLSEHEAAISFLKNAGMSPEEASYAEYMQAFARQIVKGLWITSFSIDGNKLSIEGRALEEGLVPKYISRLKQEPVMAGYRLEKLEMHLPKETEQGNAPWYIDFSILSERGGT